MGDVAPGMERCGCSPDCDYIRCVTCGIGDCKWPGVCSGKCRECGGGPVHELQLVEPDGTKLTVSEGCSFCSEACYRVDHERAVAAGLIVSMSDLTPEQVNELFNRSGLALVGVGPRRPS